MDEPIDARIGLTSGSADVDRTTTRRLAARAEWTLSVPEADATYSLRASMPDGPVETLFGHSWSPAEDGPLTVRFDRSGAEFAP
mgnify:CR=1 FL=1